MLNEQLQDNNDLKKITSPRTKGIILMLVSALVFSTAGLFTKGVAASAWNVIFWRGVFATLLTLLFILWRGRLEEEVIGLNRWGWFVALIGASGTAAFLPAFKLTTIANVSLIYASAPLLAAIFAWAWLRERPTLAAIAGALLAGIGVGCIVSGSLGSFSLTGDLLALWMTIAIAALMVIYRKFQNLPAAGPAMISSLLLLPVALLFDDPLSVLLSEIAILAVFGLVFALASVLMAEGAKRLPSGETALLSATEAPFAVLLASIIFLEVPAFATIIGGILILLAVIISQIGYFGGKSDANR